MFSQDEIRDLVERASTLDERCAGGYRPDGGPGNDDAIARRVQGWCAAIGGDEEQLRRRLAGDGINLDEVRPLLGGVTLDEGRSLPDWARTFEWAAPAMVAKFTAEQPRDGVCDPPVPFEELFIPLATEASLRCARTAAGVPGEVAETALQRALVERMSQICAPSLYDGFVLARMFQGGSLGFVDLPDANASSRRDQYDRFLGSLRTGELKELFSNRPVLARLVGTVVGLWMRATDQFVQRLRNDIDLIGRTFNAGRPLGELVDMKWGLSDSHNGAETVCRLSFASGLVVGYKPKDLHIDRAWKRFIDWLADNGAPASCRAPSVLTRPGYGWVEWLSPRPCQDRAAAHRHFRHAGSLLCLLHLLRGTDFHWENVLAVADMPAPVDLETLFHPRATQFAEWPGLGEVAALADRILTNSVLSTGYLPHWVQLPGDDVLGVGGLDPRQENRSRFVFDNVNTDGMTFRKTPVRPFDGSSAASLDGMPLRVADFEQELTDGFAAMYRFLVSRRQILLEPTGPLQWFAGLKIRVVLRPTAVYALVLHHARNRQHLSDGVSWSVNFDFLSRLSSLEHRRHPLNLVQPSERQALSRLDIPFFSTSTNGLHLILNDRDRLENCLKETPLSSVRASIAEMSEEALEQELTFVRLALHASTDRTEQLVAPWIDDGEASGSKGRGPAISNIRDTLVNNAISGADGVTWIGTSPLANERVEVSDIGYSLYHGAPGPALFFAALADVTGSPTDRDWAYRALRPLRNQLASSERRLRLARTTGIGGASGLGGIAYALAKISRFLRDEDLLSDAFQFAHLITRETILADRRLDVIDGAAGALLSLLALHRLRPDDRVLEMAVTCGNHLLEQQKECGVGGRAWVTFEPCALTGFSHGAAGIAYALLRLAEVDTGGNWSEAALAAVSYESALYTPAEQNWPDLRTLRQRDEGQNLVCQWCHGASGIGLARLGGLDVVDTADIRGDILAAIEKTVHAPRSHLDHLCCGNFGRLEFLLAAGRHFGRNDLISVARSRSGELIDSAARDGRFRWWLGDDRFNPGFFTGLAGVGYTLLRMEEPDLLPSILLWE